MGISLPKKKRVIFAALSALTSIVCVSVIIANNLSCNFHHKTPTAIAPIEVSPTIETISYIIKAGDTFAGILSHFGICGTAFNCVYTTLNGVGFSKIFPGDSLVIVRDIKSREIKTIALLNRLSSWYKVNTNGDSAVIEKRNVGLTRYRCLVKGELTTSISENLLDLGVGAQITNQIADIFGWDINFFTDPQVGDKFEIVFEKNFRDGKFESYGRILSAKYVNSGKTFFAIGLEDSLGHLDYYDLSGHSLRKQFLKAPLSYSRISSTFSLHRLHPVLGIVRPHLGVDYAAPTGTPVYASAAGRVVSAAPAGGFGNFVRIAHNNGYESMYGHLSHFAKGIHAGSKVSQGDLIGYVGATGLATGPHLDYRLKRDGAFVNPLTLKVPSNQNVPAGDVARFDEEKSAAEFQIEQRFSSARKGLFVLDINIPDDSAGIVRTTAVISGLNHVN